jgi:membrane protein YdbS with pleckstrin-like domain
MTDHAAPGLSPALRTPAHQVSPRTVTYWRVGYAVTLGFLVLAGLVNLLLREWTPWWSHLVVLGLVVLVVVQALVVPQIRYRIHRWEVTPTAIYAQSGWLSRQMRIAPLSRVQTVDTKQSGLQRLFRIASVTVTTASAAGPITIFGLDADEARRVVAELTEITGASEGDAT